MWYEDWPKVESCYYCNPGAPKLDEKMICLGCRALGMQDHLCDDECLEKEMKYMDELINASR